MLSACGRYVMVFNGEIFNHLVLRLQLALACAAGTAVELAIQASRSWTPSASGDSADERPLAFKLIAARLQH